MTAVIAFGPSRVSGLAVGPSTNNHNNKGLPRGRDAVALQNLVVVLVSALGLITVAKTVVEILMTWVLPNKASYRCR